MDIKAILCGVYLFVVVMLSVVIFFAAGGCIEGPEWALSVLLLIWIGLLVLPLCIGFGQMAVYGR